MTHKRKRHLEWRGDRLVLKGGGRGSLFVELVRDVTYPSMWRVRLPDGSLTDMVNRTRAKDAACALLLAHLRQARDSLEAPPASFAGATLVGESSVTFCALW